MSLQESDTAWMFNVTEDRATSIYNKYLSAEDSDLQEVEHEPEISAKATKALEEDRESEIVALLCDRKAQIRPLSDRLRPAFSRIKRDRGGMRPKLLGPIYV
ncbi:hypothetical protein Z517_05056 [Fonsecaea pedrosoi CBS 271.37]|uniref:Uncharacterized protein n=1 Tax=Fonsecaea pedrosoi CBS 271.37 TaxID=1442368 RepID=A0A0D2HBY9_9EURO|nr:uncharacterized protein Z517_05056 [Fonsecaea pedrosoi CBS 271.37]KIW82029.1 hypothetical protein Z517_05056 [Fonsecaea pedrosoi CBS 271.37]